MPIFKWEEKRPRMGRSTGASLDFPALGGILVSSQTWELIGDYGADESQSGGVRSQSEGICTYKALLPLLQVAASSGKNPS